VSEDELHPPQATKHPEAYPYRPAGERVATISDELGFLLRAEVALAKAELRASTKAGVTAVANFAVAGVAGFLVLVFGSVTLGQGLTAAGWDSWLAFLAVTALWLLVALVGVLVGRARMARVRGPERAVETSKEIPDALVPGRTPPPTSREEPA
jgi:hypothetical protein